MQFRFFASIQHFIQVQKILQRIVKWSAWKFNGVPIYSHFVTLLLTVILARLTSSMWIINYELFSSSWVSLLLSINLTACVGIHLKYLNRLGWVKPLCEFLGNRLLPFSILKFQHLRSFQRIWAFRFLISKSNSKEFGTLNDYWKNQFKEKKKIMRKDKQIRQEESLSSL